jgi:hypothetical protein
MNIEKMLKLSLFVLIILASFNSVYSLGMGDPLPPDLKFLRNSVGKFFFTIFATDSSADLNCKYVVTGIEPLTVTFDEKEVVVKAFSETNIHGSISVPGDAELKSYSGNIKVTCEPILGPGVTGSKIIQSANANLKFSVVEKLEEGTTTTLPEEKKTEIPTSAILLVIIVIIAILVVSLYYWSKRKSGHSTPTST